MSPYTFHINLYDLAFLGTVFIGLTFTLLLWFTKRTNRIANRFLALALLTIVLWMAWVLGADIRMGAYVPHWSWLPLQFTLAIGPLIYFYVLKITRPAYKLGWKDLLHFGPSLLQQVALILEINESISTAAATYDTLIFKQQNPVLQLLAAISVIIYLYWSHRLIEHFYQRLKFNGGDRYRYELRWLHRLLVGFGLLWLLWIPYSAVDYFYYHHHLGTHAYYPLYLLLAVMMIWIAAVAFLRLAAGGLVEPPPFLKPPLPAEMKQRGTWLKRKVKASLYYQDPELSLSSLAEKLELTTHELSRIINTALKKSFNDFINEYRVADVVQKIQDPAYDHITLLGIAFESGFNSQSTFTRIFKHMTGKSPLVYKNDLKKDYPSYNLGSQPRFAAIISYRETTPKWSSEQLNRNYMFRNYLKIALRNLVRNKLYSFINVAGLAAGLASAILIFLWVQDELSHDRFFTKIDRIYLMNGRVKLANGEIGVGSDTPKPMGPAIKSDYPEAEEVTRVRNAHFLISNGDKHFGIPGHMVDASFLRLFDFPMLEGNPNTALSSVSDIVLTQKAAKKLFGNADALGKTVRVDSVNYATVTGILKDLPNNSSFDFEYLIPWSYGTKVGRDDKIWDDNSVSTFVLLKQGASLDAFNKKVDDIVIKHINAYHSIVHAFAQPYKDAWLYSNVENGNYVAGKIKQVRLFTIIAVFILLIACINFTNLSTARSEKRAKEVGIRKVVGAQKYSLIIQFIGESILLALAAGIIAVMAVVLVLPAFDEAIGQSLSINYWNPWYYLYTLCFILFAGFAAGVYPAFFLSSFQPVKVLKGTFQSINTLVTPRKILVVLQFTFAIVFIICTVIVEGQIKYAENRDAGYSRNNLAFLRMTGDASKNYKLIKHDLLASGSATAVTATSGPMTELWSNGSGYQWPGSEADDKKTVFNMYSSEDDFSKTMNLSVSQGRDIDMKNYRTDSTAVVLNQAAVKVMRLKNPVGTIIKSNNTTLHVVGVVKDFILESPYEPVHPMLIMGPVFPFYVINFRLNPNPAVVGNLAKAEQIFKRYNPNYPFDIHYYDQEYAFKFADEQREGKLAGLFAGLSVFISCLGLFGLVTYMAENRVKEIGVRKVLGASVANVVGLLSKEFLRLIAISFIIASPVAWFIMHKWLLNYEYRITIQWWVFAGTGLLSFLIAMVTVIFQAIKAALANPVKSLRVE